MKKVTVYWINSDEWGKHEAYFVDGKCTGVYTGHCGGVVEQICKAGVAEFEEHECTDDEWRGMILQLSGFGKPVAND